MSFFETARDILSPKRNRPHPYQISDSFFDVRADCGQWAVFENYRVLTSQREKDEVDRPLGWFDTRQEALAEVERLSR